MNRLARLTNILIVSALLVGLYIFWTHSLNPGNLAIIALAAIVSSVLFVSSEKMPIITLKKIAYSIAYIGYMFIAIVKSTMDVAKRVVRKEIPLNPGIVKVKTHLQSKAGRMILANSITLTPGTLSVDVQDDYYYIHWIDITTLDVEEASQEIVAGFEKYLEVIFG
ncbi:MAG TPA: Na+/H+ antiporter subunit E [Balneolales bacterium]|jgi:multicomponent Na+:H+ antiporter subunit E|nr:Na+/H+ antiporter subunit E [Balneolales bacterium]